MERTRQLGMTTCTAAKKLSNWRANSGGLVIERGPPRGNEWRLLLEDSVERYGRIAMKAVGFLLKTRAINQH